jgi:hypothetical protein
VFIGWMRRGGLNMENTTSSYFDTVVKQIKEEQDLEKKVNLVADVMLETDKKNNTMFNEILSMIGEVKAALLGNGKPEKSLITRVDKIEDDREKVIKRNVAVIFGIICFIAAGIGTWIITSLLNLF